MREIIVQGVTTPVRESGAGSPVILLHGVPDSGALWDAVVAKLNGQFRCIAPDMPGLGDSMAPANFDYSLENRARWVQDLLDALEIREPVNIVGHDHGGLFAAAWAVTHEDRMRRLCLMDTLFHRDYHWHIWARLWRTPLAGEFFMYGQLLPFNSWIFEAELRRGSRQLSRDHVREAYKRLRYPALRQTLRLYRATSPAALTGWDDRLYALIRRIPTLVLWGDRDPYIPLDFPLRLQQKGAKLIRFPDAGHWIPVEKADAVAKHLAEFFAG